jgi:membrane-associated protease RseP (regulator of RpoE activity)
MAFALTPEISFLLGLAVFWLALYVIAYVFHLDKHGLDTKPGYFMYRSKALNSFIDQLAQKGRLFWKTCANLSIAFGVGLMVFSLYFVVSNLLRFIFPLGPASPVFPVIPVLTISLNWLPYFFVAVAVIVLTHELAHGVTARLANIPVLSTGLVAFLVFFGAFVEPDEKEFEKASLLSRLRMLAAGSSTNLITALLVFLLMSACFAQPAGVLIYNVAPTGPLAKSGANVQIFDVIQAVNGTPVSTYNQYFNLTSNVGPNETLTLTILHANRQENITVVTAQSPSNISKGIVGFEVGLVPNYIPTRFGLDQYLSMNLYLSLFWIYLLGVSVAIFNMLPAFPFDGERVLYYPLANLMKKRTRELRYALNIIIWGLFVLNVALSFLRFGLLAI